MVARSDVVGCCGCACCCGCAWHCGWLVCSEVVQVPALLLHLPCLIGCPPGVVGLLALSVPLVDLVVALCLLTHHVNPTSVPCSTRYRQAAVGFAVQKLHVQKLHSPLVSLTVLRDSCFGDQLSGALNGCSD